MKTLLQCAIVLIATECRADRNTDISPILAKPGDVVFEDSLERAELAERWASTDTPSAKSMSETASGKHPLSNNSAR